MVLRVFFEKTVMTRISALRNSKTQYGLVVRIVHWGMAAAIFGMFGLGLWMRSLDYYSPWYKTGPDLHRSIGMVLLAILIFRLLWRLIEQQPSEDHLKPWERTISLIVHRVFYLILFTLMIAGYLISTVDGRPIDVFGLVSVPPVIERKGLEDIAGFVHEYLAYGLMALAGVHAAAALKHHFLDRDVTLRRMWFSSPPHPPKTTEERESP